MARGGKRTGSGRKAVGDRVAVLVRLKPDVEQRIESLRDGRSMSATVESLLKIALNGIQDEEDTANSALGFIIAQAANAASWNDRTWRNDPSTAKALKLATSLIIDLLAPSEESANEAGRHPFFASTDEHARQIFFWVLNRLKERGDEYGSDWPAGHPLRNFPRAATALDLHEVLGGKRK